jgi:hypothetical protein
MVKITTKKLKIPNRYSLYSISLDIKPGLLVSQLIFQLKMQSPTNSRVPAGGGIPASLAAKAPFFLQAIIF